MEFTAAAAPYTSTVSASDPRIWTVESAASTMPSDHAELDADVERSLDSTVDGEPRYEKQTPVATRDPMHTSMLDRERPTVASATSQGGDGGGVETDAREASDARGIGRPRHRTPEASDARGIGRPRHRTPEASDARGIGRPRHRMPEAPGARGIGSSGHRMPKVSSTRYLGASGQAGVAMVGGEAHPQALLKSK